ncbi:MAG: hypothetical protein IKD03_04155 [Clostridia bacterium]|nr:hypothetical protein [Clostridia bacterium]
MENFTVCGCPVLATTSPFSSTLTALPSPLTVFAHGVEINLIEEMDGREMTLRKITNLSLATKGTVIVGCTLAYYNIKRLSAVIAHDGKLIDIVDACSVSPPFSPSGWVKIFSDQLKYAVLVGGDARVNFIMQKLKGKCHAVIALEPEYRPENENRVRQLSKTYALPVLYVSPKRIFLTN